MKLKMHQVDAFANRVFAGNPAAIVPLESWLPDATLQAIAEENNLAETAFFVPQGDGFHLRWFTPATEVDLCGHATLASAYVLYDLLGYTAPQIRFHTRSGILIVERDGSELRMTFPATLPLPCATPPELITALGRVPKFMLSAYDYVAVFETEEEIRSLTLNFNAMMRLDLRGLIATAPGRDCDFVSRFFAPKLRINEDPVTGSAHCELAPYWAGRLGRNRLTAQQLSARGGSLICELEGAHVVIIGSSVLYMTAEISIP
ncbi:MAG: PhzF family phenazine biosynthesis protein [Acidobacteriaceae bacterium]|nr:PhzF family phenazine biosynthesis protein [Acidobacteriaceae bacterium]